MSCCPRGEFYISGIAWVIGADCNPKSREMHDAPLLPHFCRPLLIASGGSTPFRLLAMPLLYGMLPWGRGIFRGRWSQSAEC